MFERFTERARKVVVLAQDEARHFNHNYIGAEHLLLGLLREDEGVAAQALYSLNVALDEVRGLPPAPSTGLRARPANQACPRPWSNRRCPPSRAGEQPGGRPEGQGDARPPLSERARVENRRD